MSEVLKIFEEVCQKMCNEYCKYPLEPVPEGKTEDWLWGDEDSPCRSCPLNRIN